MDVQISASINSSFFSGTSNTFAINVLAFESIFDLSNVLISSPITVNIFTLGDTNYKLTDELIKNLNISNLNNKMFQQPVSIIEAAVSDVCSAASLNEDYEIQLPLSTQDTYDSTHPLVEGKLISKNTSKVVGESKINFKINIVQYEQIENTQYVGSFNMFQNSSYTASANMFDKSNQKGVPDNWRDNEINLNFTLDNDVYQYLTFSYDSHGLYELKD
ncbi:MAG: hypothetical protein K2L48_03600 [Mycoplasmoidaceae bacterium]|nr:hypothetical protein [Mycoplasmoidaceae bacterium]